MKIQIEELVREFDNLKKEKKVPEDFNSEDECRHLQGLLEQGLGEKLVGYDRAKAEGAGGSGIVLSATYTEFNMPRALKFPRKQVFEKTGMEEDEIEVDPELHALSKVSHKNITRLYEAIAIPTKRLFVLITEYVNEPLPLDKYAVKICCSKEMRENSLMRTESLRKLSKIVGEIVEGIMYMHQTALLYHFDIKPDNILLSKDGVPYITDLGFARDISKYSPKDLIKIGFTWKYAHKILTNPYTGARISKTPLKSKNELPGEKLTPQIDLFAFGRSIQEVLKGIEDIHGESIYTDYHFNYLHLVACLCLDGRNANDANSEDLNDFVSDQALGIPVAFFKKKKFSSFEEVHISMQRLLGERRLEEDLPELDKWASSTLNVSDLGVTTLTPRLKGLIEHPIMQRLMKESQLGMMDTIFPTSTHSRFQHSIGVYHAVCEYLTALYYNHENPTFRVVFSTKKCKTLLVASLLHDVGHTTFGHELEEANKKEFDHEEIGKYIILNSKEVDSEDRTIKEIIESNASDCWNIPVDDVVNLMDGEAKDPVDNLLIDILIGQFDADKLDYLIRDSIECRVSYGKGIDYHRFMRSLSTHVVEVSLDESKMRLAIKRKGAASAEAFAFARYQLYQSLYWHHTFRAIKAMLLTAAKQAYFDLDPELKSKGLFDKHPPLRMSYLKYVIGLSERSFDEDIRKSFVQDKIDGKKKKAELTPIKRLLEKLKDIENLSIESKYSKDKTLRFIWAISTSRSRTLIENLMKRKYYKRMIEIPLSEFNEDGRMKLHQIFSTEERIDLHQKIEDSLFTILRKAIQDKSKIRHTFKEDKILERAEKIAAENFCFIIDFPTRGWSPDGDEPIFISDFKRKYYRGSQSKYMPAERSRLWSENLSGMMGQIAFFRVYCHPELHRILRQVLKIQDILTIINNLLSKSMMKR